jgi:hypothetical protein
LFTARPENLAALLSGKSKGEIEPSAPDLHSTGSAGEAAAAGTKIDEQHADGTTGTGPSSERRTGGAGSNADGSSPSSTVLPNIPKQDLRKLLRMRDDFRKEKLARLERSL